MSEEATAEAATEVKQDNKVIENEQIVKDDAQEVTTEAATKQEVEIDYKSEYSKQQELLAKENKKIGNQKAALAQLNKQIQEQNAKIAKFEETNKTKEPSLDDFDTMDEHRAASQEYWKQQGIEQGKKLALESNAQALQQETAQKAAIDFNKAEHNYRQSMPSYDSAKSALEVHAEVYPLNPQVMQTIGEQAAREGILPDVINYYGNNLDAYDALQGKTPAETAIEIYKLSQTLKAKVIEKTKPLPKPIKSVKGTSNAGKALNKMSYQELKKTIYKK